LPAPSPALHAVEAFADLLFALDSEDEGGALFYGRLCQATCRLADLDRAVIFLYDEARRRVRAVGGHGIDLALFEDLHVTLEAAPIAATALAEDRVVEVAGDFTQALPAEYRRFLAGERLVCAPMSAAGRWPGVILAERAADRPLSEAERHLLWTLGKIAALAASARLATREHERSRALQERLDLARDLHEGVVQRLFGVSLALASSDEPLPAEQRRRCASEIHEALADLETVVQRPLGRPSPAARTTLVEEVRRLANEHRGLRVELRGHDGTPVPPHLESLAQSVLVEALRNAIKHGAPTRVDVAVEQAGGAFVLEVVNDGATGAASATTGMGLRLAAFEALQHGGVVEFGRLGEDRWRVRLIAPSEARR